MYALRESSGYFLSTDFLYLVVMFSWVYMHHNLMKTSWRSWLQFPTR